MKRLLLLGLVVPMSFALAEAAPAASQSPGMSPFIPLIIIFAIFYFLILRPQQKKNKQHKKFVTELKRGEMVVTNAGIIGTIKNVSEKFVTLEVDRDVCIKILKNQISESANALKDTKETKKTNSTAAQRQE